MSEELKPCPFEASHVRKGFAAIGLQMRGTIAGILYYYGCGECGSRGPERNTHDDALAAWNLRSEPAGKETK